MKYIASAVLLFTFSPLIVAQSAISLDSQIYPAGVITGLRFEFPISEQTQVFVRGGFNITDRRNWGVQKEEEGQGFGIGGGIEFTNSNYERLSMILRTDIWFLNIDWQKPTVICPIVPPCFESDTPQSTKVTVLQPTIGFGYQIPVSGSFFLKPSLSLGYEINVHTRGEEVGEGTIILGGIQAGYRF
jgi:hypothetical protein